MSSHFPSLCRMPTRLSPILLLQPKALKSQQLPKVLRVVASSQQAVVWWCEMNKVNCCCGVVLFCVICCVQYAQCMWWNIISNSMQIVLCLKCLVWTESMLQWVFTIGLSLTHKVFCSCLFVIIYLYFVGGLHLPASLAAPFNSSSDELDLSAWKDVARCVNVLCFDFRGVLVVWCCTQLRCELLHMMWTTHNCCLMNAILWWLSLLLLDRYSLEL